MDILSFGKLEIATATQRHCQNVYRNDNIAEPSQFTVETIMNNIHCTFCNSYIELVAAIYGLRKLLNIKREVY